MSSSEDEDVFSVRKLYLKQNKNRAKDSAKAPPSVKRDAQSVICDFDDLLNSGVAVLKAVKNKTVQDDSDISDPDDEDIPTIERIKMKRQRKAAHAAEQERRLRKNRPSEMVVVPDSSDDERTVKTRSQSGRGAKRKSASPISSCTVSSDEGASMQPPANKKRSPSMPEIEQLNVSVSSSRVEPSDIDCEVVDLNDTDTILEVRYLVKDFSGMSIATFFCPSDVKVVDLEERFKNKLDPTIPYLYFFTDNMEPFDPEKTPVELGWDLSKPLIVRIHQSSQISFHLAAKAEAAISAAAAVAGAVDADDGRILVKFQMKDKRPLKILISPTDKFSKIKADFCEAHDLNISKCFLIFDNERLGDDETPNDYEMERNDCIDVHAA